MPLSTIATILASLRRTHDCANLSMELRIPQKVPSCPIVETSSVRYFHVIFQTWSLNIALSRKRHSRYPGKLILYNPIHLQNPLTPSFSSSPSSLGGFVSMAPIVTKQPSLYVIFSLLPPLFEITLRIQWCTSVHFDFLSSKLSDKLKLTWKSILAIMLFPTISHHIRGSAMPSKMPFRHMVPTMSQELLSGTSLCLSLSFISINNAS